MAVVIPIRVGGVTVSSVVADSREARAGSLFVALPGTRVNGSDYVGDAHRRGAAAAITDDPLVELGRVGALVRRRSKATVVGIAGAVGKTSTKDILHALCAPHVMTIASRESYNNELGVPLTLCRLESCTEVAICELGTGAPGELAGLCAIAAPDIGVVTSVGAEHLRSFGSVSEAVREEAALIEALPHGATVVLPAREPLLQRYLRADLTTVTFGRHPDADVRLLRWQPGLGPTAVDLDIRGVRVRFRTNLRAPHQCLNLCAAVAVYAALGLPLERIRDGADEIELSRWRDHERRTPRGARVVNDAYNANPVSMRAALFALAARRNGGRTVAVLGEMAELGIDTPAWHRRIGRLAATTGVDLVVAVGPLAQAYRGAETRWFADTEAAGNALPGLVRRGDVVLLKGSRAAGLEQLVEAIP